MTTYFCDGLREVVIVNGVARLHFQRIEPGERGAIGERAGHEMRAVPDFAIAMPVQGLVQALATLEKLRDQMIREGVLRPAGQPEGETPPPPARSPNFS
jgi:hypothetical protein